MVELFKVRDVAGCNQPRTQEDVAYLEREGIGAILSLNSALPEEWLHGFCALAVPVRDFAAPTIEQLDTCVGFLRGCVDQGLTPVAHCTMGYGRTGTVLAAYLIAQGSSARDAIREVRAVRPGAIETASQEHVLLEYEATLRARDEHTAR